MQFEPGRPIYVASGIFQTEPEFAREHLPGWMVFYGRMLLNSFDLEHLDLEQLAAIDYLVAVKAAKFIGWAGSSFSFWIPQERALQGLHADSSHLILGDGTVAWHNGWAVSNAIIQ